PIRLPLAFLDREAAAALLLACMPEHAVTALRKQTRLAQPLSIGATASARIELEADETCSQRV
ncbi:hypothetical protein, partial [Xanthomonas perforans]|uniref:hypothetical protein n=1 Tax=Xanthomonas perforans TaxID=442694 RepID=UPI0010280DE4